MLFTLVADGLNRLICMSKVASLIGGLLACRKTYITNLQYADNTISFGKVNIQEALVWKWILHSFELWSGLKINYEKSNIIFIGESIDNL